MQDAHAGLICEDGEKTRSRRGVSMGYELCIKPADELRMYARDVTTVAA